MPCLIDSIFFSPIPLRPASVPPSIALTSSSRLVMSRSFQSSAMVLGPRPGISSSGSNPAGTLAATSSKSVLRPVLTYSLMILQLDAPIPSISFSFPCLQSLRRSNVASLRIRLDLGKRDRLEGALALDLHEGREGLE